MAEFLKCAFAIVILVIFQILSIGGCPPRCVTDGKSCTFEKPAKCCSLLCLAQYGICGKDCARVNTNCAVSADCCSPLSCKNKICCTESGNSCNSNSECCTGLSCNNKICVKPCGTTDYDCVDSSDCCSGLECHLDLYICCTPANVACTSGPECCSSVCHPDTLTCV